MKKVRVGVFMGGKSIEREVSLQSGRTVCDHLDTARYDAIPIFQTKNGNLYLLPWHFLHRGKTSDFEHRLASEARCIGWDDLKNVIDFMYIAAHGRFAEDGTLQGFLEILQIPYLGSGVFGSAVGMDKIMQKELLSVHGIDVAKGIVIYPYELVTYKTNHAALLDQLTRNKINFPVVIKPYKEGSSLGVSIVHTPEELFSAVEKAASVYPAKQQAVLIEEKITGMEFSCISIMDAKTHTWRALPPTEVVADEELFDYEQKYMPGRATEFTPPRAHDTDIALIQETCVRVSQALDMKTISRVDGFLTPDKKVVVIDPNTLSGMGPSSFLFREAAQVNISHSQLINHLIETELAHHEILATMSQRKEENAMQTPKIRVAILMGGRSNEREISLESGRNISYKLSPHTYEAIPLFVNSRMELYRIDQRLLVRNSTKEIEHLVTPEMLVQWNDLPQIADFVFIGLHGGEGENGCVQGALEMLVLSYNGSSVLASALCMDKFKTNQFLHSKGFDVPRGLLISQEEWLAHPQDTLQRVNTQLPFPIIVKPHDDGCSVMVQKIKSNEALSQALALLFASGKEYALVEECIMGMELTVGVIGNDEPHALPPSQAVATSEILSIEEKFLPGAGENQTPAPLPASALTFVQYTMEQVFKAVGCKGYARIDCFYQSPTQSPTGKERVVILEINTLPGMTPATCIFHQAAELGIKPMDFIDRIIRYGFEEHGHHHDKKEQEITTHEMKQEHLSY